jgi:hypothetical protein
LKVSGSINANQAGQVIQGLKINGCIDVTASNVTIKDDEIIGNDPESFCVNIANGVSNTLIEDTTIHGQDAGGNAVEYAVRDMGNNTHLLRVNLYWCTECLAGTSTSIKDSYVHDLANVSSAHYEDIYDGGGSGLSVVHNTLYNAHGQTAAIYMSPDSGEALTNITINNNLLGGGGYTVYGGMGPGPNPSRVAVTDNLFTTIYYAAAGQYGEVDYWMNSGNTWSSNMYTDGVHAGATAS